MQRERRRSALGAAVCDGWRRRGAGALGRSPVAKPGPSQQPGGSRRMSMSRAARPSGGAEVSSCLVYTRHD